MATRLSRSGEPPVPQRRSILLMDTAAIVGLSGAGSLLAGAWLIAPGKGWYHAIAGAAMLVTA